MRIWKQLTAGATGAALLFGAVGTPIMQRVPVAAQTTAFAAEEEPANTADGFAYQLAYGEVTILGYTGTETELEIPAEIAGAPVVYLGDHAFSDCNALTSVTIPDSVFLIGENVFAGCSSLKSIQVSSENAHFNVQNGVLFNQKLSKLICCPAGYAGEYDIPDSVTSIGTNAFSDCSALTAVSIPDSVTSIDWRAFSDCASLTAVTIPDSVTSIGANAFSDCAALTSLTLSNGLTRMKSRTFENCTSLTSVVIPDSVTAIEDNVFVGCEALSAVSIPDGVTDIEFCAFENCTSLASVTIPDSVTNIGADAFLNSAVYSSVQNGVVYVDGWAVDVVGDYDSVLVLPDTTRGISGWAFEGCSALTAVTIPDSVAAIGECAFFDCNALTSVTIPSGVTEIGISTFNGCNALTWVTIPDSVTDIGGYAFWDTAIYDNVENGVVYVDGWAVGCVGDCDAVLQLEDSTRGIGKYAFNECPSLTSVTIGEHVTNIGACAFLDCTALTEIQVSPENPYYSSVDGVLFDKDCCKLIYCPVGYTGSYSIPDSVTSIEDYAFEGCTALTSVILPERVTKIGESAFASCDALFSVNLPDSVTDIGASAFCCCGSLNTIRIPDGITSIGSFLFDQCDALTAVRIPESVTSIAWYAFWGCTSLPDIYYAGTEEQWNAIDFTYVFDSFFETASLTTATIHFAENEIPAQPFVRNPDGTLTLTQLSTDAESVVIPLFSDGAIVSAIADGALADCPNLKTVYGYLGTAAQTYAAQNELAFRALGDLNNDARINVNDAILALKAVADSLVGKEMTDETQLLGDVDRNAHININDAILLLKYYATDLTKKADWIALLQ